MIGGSGVKLFKFTWVKTIYLIEESVFNSYAKKNLGQQQSHIISEINL